MNVLSASRRLSFFFPASALPSLLAFAIAWTSAAARVFGGLDIRYWSAGLASAIFIVAQVLFRHSRISRDRLLCPANWLLATFFLQLIILPHLIEWFGPEVGVLPRLPTAHGINHAVLLNGLAFFAFSAGMHFTHLMAQGRAAPPPARTPSRAVAVGLAALGLAGIVLGFGSLSGFAAALADPPLMLNTRALRAGTLQGAAATFLSPLLALGVVALWAGWFDVRGRRLGDWARRGFTAVACVCVVVAGLSFGFNRAAVVVPLAALAAAYYWGRPRTRAVVLGVIAVAVLVLAALTGAYRGAVNGRTFNEGISDMNIGSYFQAYAMAPQFPAYFMESVEASGRRLGPSVLLRSAISPVPVLGKNARETAGPAIYNRLIYGDLDAADQISPFIAEVTLSAGVVGMVLAYLLIGGMTAKLQYAFLSAASSFSAWVAQYVGIWFAFLVVGSLSSFSQIVIYFFWPLILLAVGRWIGRMLRPKRRRGASLCGLLRVGGA